MATAAHARCASALLNRQVCSCFAYVRVALPRFPHYIPDTMPDKPKIKALFSLPQSIKTRVEAEAYWSRRTQSEVVEQALREALDRAEAERVAEPGRATGT